MNRTRIAIAVAAMLAAAPAFAQTMSSTASGTAQDQHSGAMSSSTQKAATPRNKASQSQRAAADQGRTPLCSELAQPDIAGKTPGMGQATTQPDCIPDGSTGASAGTSTTVARNGTLYRGNVPIARTNNSATGSTSAGTTNSTTAGATHSTSAGTTNSTTASAGGAKTPSSNTGR